MCTLQPPHTLPTLCLSPLSFLHSFPPFPPAKANKPLITKQQPVTPLAHPCSAPTPTLASPSSLIAVPTPPPHHSTPARVLKVDVNQLNERRRQLRGLRERELHRVITPALRLVASGRVIVGAVLVALGLLAGSVVAHLHMGSGEPPAPRVRQVRRLAEETRTFGKPRLQGPTQSQQWYLVPGLKLPTLPPCAP